MIPNNDQQALRETVRRFARECLLPGYQKREAEGRLDRALMREMGQMGLLAADVPERLGGMGLDGVTTGMICEELAYGDFNMAGLSVEMSLLAAIMTRSAPAPIVDEWVPRMTRGEAIVAICVTEPRGGSDASSLQMRARRDGDDFVLNGEKTSISFADSADAFLVFARTGTPDSGARGITAFFVPGDASGIQRTRFTDVGCRIQGRGSVFFDDVRVPAANILAAEGKGFTEVMVGFDYSRALIALQCIGAAQASLDEAWAYTRERQAFGRPIAQFQGVTFPLVDGESTIAAVRQLAYHALALRDAGLPHTAEAAMVKWMGPKTAVDVIHQCLLTFGHYGYSLDTPHQQRMRDVTGLEIGDGTAGVMKLIIARERVGREAVQYL
ncbi:acyl-CoA dehydrogenase family protein [Aromatoleum petrolei]|uniref:Cyclohexanecarboxyl-CoA dehydrogenase n=1 Tax=Aromatoleum petrolei TaxID=76116 RepID=A0ABX1MGP9_9RHOO|nr:acyl-CoA dehydrogenase family protein [Aromatoleum petrolei]NMF87127.1 cyclohexanecarboxyl-CoA dehydrogenase [Aromatoleum petrolei]QTQ34865.1 Acyl-CoA dehydrogenase [Aromatoleum petrolei]